MSVNLFNIAPSFHIIAVNDSYVGEKEILFYVQYGLIGLQAYDKRLILEEGIYINLHLIK